MPHFARGTFDVTATKLPPYDSSEGAILSRTTITKRFHGDLEATSIVEMISAVTTVKGSAGYVAIERVRGKLLGRAGTFVLQHSGSMTRGRPELTVTVVPDSATGELVGLSGRMTIDIVDGEHRYGFEHELPGGETA